MKKLIGMAIFGLAVAGFALDASAQGRGGRGGMGGGGMMSRLMILNMGGDNLSKELDLSDDQAEQLADLREEMRGMMGRGGQGGGGGGGGGRGGNAEAMAEMEKEVMGILTDKQKKRLTGIFVQVAGFNALMDNEVAEAIGLSEDDQADLKEAIEDAGMEMREQMQELMQSEDRGAMREKMMELRDEANKKIMGMLSESQRKKLEDLKGATFEMPQRGRGGAGGQGGAGGGGRGGQGGGRGGQGGDGGGGDGRTDF